MISLYESILSSTGSGKNAMIKKWCEENFDKKYKMVVTPAGRIETYQSTWNISFDLLPDIPDYIKFGELHTNVYLGDRLNTLSQDQLPTLTNVLYISGKTGTIPSFRIKCQSLYINEYHHKLTKIDPIELEIYDDNWRKSFIWLDNTQVDIESIKNIHVTGEVYQLGLDGTPAGIKIKKEALKRRKNNESRELDGCDDYLNDLFQSYSGLQVVRLTPRTELRRSTIIPNKWRIL